MTREDSITPGRRLANHVKARRQDLELSQKRLAESAGLGLTTVQSIERGESDQPLGETRRGLERALGWAPRSVAAILVGGSPRETEGITHADAEYRAAQEELTSATIALGAAQRVGDEAAIAAARERVVRSGHLVQLAATLVQRQRDEAMAEYEEGALDALSDVTDEQLLQEVSKRMAARHAVAAATAVGGEDHDLPDDLDVFALAADDLPGVVKQADQVEHLVEHDGDHTEA